MPWHQKTTSAAQHYRPQAFLNDIKNPLAALTTPSLGLVSAKAKTQMVQRLEKNTHHHPTVLAALGMIDRHLFVDSALASRAYDDIALPIGFKQTISQPSIIASMLTLACEARYTNGIWLEIGTGCGYQAAIMACCTEQVCSIERIEGLHQQAILNLALIGQTNLTLCLGDGTQPWQTQYRQQTPMPTLLFDAIVVAAAGLAIAPCWLAQLHLGGRLIAPMQDSTGEQRLHLVERRSLTEYHHQILHAVQFVPLLKGTAPKLLNIKY